MRILLVGDVHGQFHLFHRALTYIRSTFSIDAAIQVGDFGFYEKTLEAFLQDDLLFPVPVYAIDGNHEDHTWLSEKSKWNPKINLNYVTRGSILMFASSKIGFLGGALNTDRPQLQRNYILPSERIRAAIAFNNSPPDLMITHSCPAAIGIGMQANKELRDGVNFYIRGKGFDPGPEEDCGEMELTKLWDSLKVRPKAWVFGHFHCKHKRLVEQTLFCSLPELQTPSIVIWDSEQKEILDIDLDVDCRTNY
ncbi:MAG: metallophosphoesterase [Oligoflexia bacterium]|nr:metallophosphoesterase [Oligoflexia bacterium]MBF0367411.1 metallophosphoesterase [Oligoflexia bacterium]